MSWLTFFGWVSKIIKIEHKVHEGIEKSAKAKIAAGHSSDCAYLEAMDEIGQLDDGQTPHGIMKMAGKKCTLCGNGN